MPLPKKAKGKDTVTYSAQNNVVEHIVEGSIASSSTVVFGNCHVGFLICRSCLEAHTPPFLFLPFFTLLSLQNCKYTLSAFCTKRFIQGMHQPHHRAQRQSAHLDRRGLQMRQREHRVQRPRMRHAAAGHVSRGIDVKFHEESRFYNGGPGASSKGHPAAATASLEETRKVGAAVVWSATHKKKEKKRKERRTELNVFDVDDSGETKTDEIVYFEKSRKSESSGLLLTGQCLASRVLPYFGAQGGMPQSECRGSGHEEELLHVV
jgi:hypothetical protein